MLNPGEEEDIDAEFLGEGGNAGKEAREVSIIPIVTCNNVARCQLNQHCKSFKRCQD